MEEFDSLQSSLDKGLFELTKLWREIGIDNVTANDRKKTVNFQFKNILDRMRYISSDVVPTTAQLEQLKDHIKRIEDEKVTREEHFIELKESVLKLNEELEEEPESVL